MNNGGKMEKIIFSDVDGTLVDHTFKITEEINQKIDKTNAQLVIATGRMYEAAKHLNLTSPVDMICSNGSEVIVDGELIHQTFMDKSVATFIVKELLQKHYFLNVYTTKGVFVPEFEGLLPIIIENTIRYAQNEVTTVNEFHENIESHLDLFYHSNKPTDDIFKELKTSEVIKIEIVDCKKIEFCTGYLSMGYGVSAYSSFGNNLEIVPKGMSKVNGIEKYLTHKQKANCITFGIGDGNNDIEMLKHVDVAIAMGNASDKLKAVADIVVAKQNEGGYLEALDYIEQYQN